MALEMTSKISWWNCIRALLADKNLIFIKIYKLFHLQSRGVSECSEVLIIQVEREISNIQRRLNC
jgi:hypothetical protein